MAIKNVTSPLIISATQGSADAFVQGSVLTGLQSRQAYLLRGIAWEITSNLQAADLNEISLTLTRRSKTAMPLISDNDVLWKMGWQSRFTTSGYTVHDRAGYIVMPLDVPIVEDTIYLQLDSTATAVANTMIIRMDVELDTISDIDRLNLIARSLT